MSLGASRVVAERAADGDRVAAVAHHRERVEVALALGGGRPRADAGQPVPHPFAVRPREEDGADGRHQREPRADAHVDAERPRRGRVGEHDDLVVDDGTGHAVEVELAAHGRHLDARLRECVLVVEEAVGERQDRGSERVGLVGVADEVAAVGQQRERRVAARLVHGERPRDLGEAEDLPRVVGQQLEDLERPLDRRHLTSHAASSVLDARGSPRGSTRPVARASGSRASRASRSTP